MSDQQDSLSPEALRSRVDTFEVPDDPEILAPLIRDISTQKLKNFRKRNTWTQKGPLSGFRANTVNDFVRRSLAKLASHHTERRKSLFWLWLIDHQSLLKRIESEVSDDSLRADVLALLDDFGRNQVAWALRFDERESIQQALEAGLWEELQDDESPLVAQHSLRNLKEEYNNLLEDKEELEDTIENLNDELTDLRSTNTNQEGEIDRLKSEVNSLEQEKGTIKQERNELNQALKTVDENLEKQKREKKKAKNRLSKLQQEIREVLTFIADVLDLSSIPEEDSTAAADLVIEQIRELQETCSELSTSVEELEQERNQLAPALPQVKRAWQRRLDSFCQEVDKQLGTLDDDLGAHTPVEDWKHWLSRERSLALSLLNEIEAPSEQHLADLKTIQNLLKLRWYLLEWIRLGLHRHLASTSILTEDSYN